MTRIAFCVALYEAHRAFLPAFMAGIRAAARGHDACLVGAVDDLIDPSHTLAGLADILSLKLTRCPAGSSPASIRRIMLSQAVYSGADVLIFADMDDMLLANAPNSHITALAEADFSYGDLCLMDAQGHDLKRRFFDGVDVPWSVADVADLQRRNFLGLSNTAIRTDCLPAAAFHVPDDIVAVDWWLFTTLLLAGRRGARTAAPVTRYRQHDVNTLGAVPPATPDALKQRYVIMQRHYRAFRAIPGMAARLSEIDERLERLAGMPPGMVAARLSALRSRSGVWFEGLDEIDLEPAAAVATVG